MTDSCCELRENGECWDCGCCDDPDCCDDSQRCPAPDRLAEVKP
jgi:hypothetical protein